jgi:hypothetical protein
MLILLTPICVNAQDEIELVLSEDYLPLDIDFWQEFWETDFDLPCQELLYADIDALDNVLLDVCLDLGVSDDDIFEMFPDIYEPDYEFFPLWKDDFDY